MYKIFVYIENQITIPKYMSIIHNMQLSNHHNYTNKYKYTQNKKNVIDILRNFKWQIKESFIEV